MTFEFRGAALPRPAVPEADAILGRELPVLDEGFVRLMDYLGGDEAIAQAARVSYGSVARSPQEDARLIQRLMRDRHTSPFEMTVLKFHIKAPIFVARQLFRHRTASLNERSGRYTQIEEAVYLPPPARLRRQHASNKQMSGAALDEETCETLLETIGDAYDTSFQIYEDLLHEGLARETARIVLPLGTYTEFYWEQNLHNLLHLLGLRLAEDAQGETRAYAEAMATIVQRVAPVSYTAWVEYVRDAVTFSATEVALLREWLCWEGADSPPPTITRDLSAQAVARFLAKVETP